MIDFLAANDLARISFLMLLFAVVTIGIYMVSRTYNRRAVVRSELKTIAETHSVRGERISLQERRDDAWSKMADAVERVGLNLADTNPDKLRKKLRAAGYVSPSAPRVFTMVKLVLVFAIPLAYILIQASDPEPMSTFRLHGVGGMMALAGLILPNLYITAKADRRREEITNGFPDCLDLTLVCVEAGLGLESAMDRVGREMVTSHPLVARLLSEATLQLRAGANREDALRRMGDQSGVDEIRSFATLLIQSDKLGTSVADTLRVYANEMREKRRLRAEEKAYRLPVLISIPLVVNMLPVMIGVLMMPGVVRVIRELIPALGTGG
ncbi:type II secretion system F family protein [Parerythrobacter aurantius]|uniref:type II secretion system F family protein n=1 Tax=Parerythrobacter aurantius TaxID=3127706 RepID=UPI003243FCD2